MLNEQPIRCPGTEPWIACIDVGSIPGARFGWASCDAPWNDPGDLRLGSVEQLVDALHNALQERRAAALGLEAPLWIPVPHRSSEIGKKRPMETGAWSAGAGAFTLATGIAQLTWVLRELRARCGALAAEVDISLDPRTLRAAGPRLVLWEACVSGNVRTRQDATAMTLPGSEHVRDAYTAARRFGEWLKTDGYCDRGSEFGDSNDLVPAISLAGMALLATNWSSDLALLRQRPFVLVANK